MNAFQKGYMYALWKLGFSEEFAAAQPPMTHEAYREAVGATPAKEVATAANVPKGKGAGGAATKAEKAGKGLAHHARRAGTWIGKNPKAALGIAGASLLGAGLAGRASS